MALPGRSAAGDQWRENAPEMVRTQPIARRRGRQPEHAGRSPHLRDPPRLRVKFLAKGTIPEIRSPHERQPGRDAIRARRPARRGDGGARGADPRRAARSRRRRARSVGSPTSCSSPARTGSSGRRHRIWRRMGTASSGSASTSRRSSACGASARTSRSRRSARGSRWSSEEGSCAARIATFACGRARMGERGASREAR